MEDKIKMKFNELSKQIIQSILLENAEKKDVNITVSADDKKQSEYKVNDAKANKDVNVSTNVNNVSDKVISITSELEKNGWTKNKNGALIKKDFSQSFSAGLFFDNSANESISFQKFAKAIVCEANQTLNFDVKLKNKPSNEQKVFHQEIPADKINSAKDMEALISKLIKEKWNPDDEGDTTSSAEKKNKSNLKDVFFDAWEKLSNEQQDAFIDFYGDKLIKLLQQTGETK